MVCLRSKNIYGPYEEKIVMKDKTPIPYTTYPPHQGGMVQLKDGSWWFVIMQDYGPIGRTPNLLPVRWEDGWPMIGVNGKMVLNYNKPNVGKNYKPTAPATTDEFNSFQLGLQWQWNHNPDESKYSLTERTGYMRLKAANKAAELSLARNTLTQRVQGPNSTGTTLVDIRGMKNGDIAGLTVFQDPYAYIAVKQTANTRKIVMFNSNKIIDSTQVFTGDSVWFRAKVSETGSADFYYSIDGKTFETFGNTLNMQLGYPWTANRFGLFNFSTTYEGLNGYVDFNWFRFSTDFYATKTTMKAGDKTQFKVGTISNLKTKFHWRFEGGSPKKSNKANPKVKYKKPGVYPVSLKSRNPIQQDTLTRKAYIKVNEYFDF
jgi:beta-xylosidase